MTKHGGISNLCLVVVPNIAFAHGQELLFYMWASQLFLLVAAAGILGFWRESMKVNLLLFGCLLVTVLAMNVIPTLPGSAAFMASLGPVGILLLFALAPLAIMGSAYGVIRAVRHAAQPGVPAGGA